MNIKCPHCGTEYEIGQSGFGKFVNCQVCGKGFVAGVRPRKKETRGTPLHKPKAMSSSLSEIKLLKTWALYWLARLLVGCAITVVVVVADVIVANLSGSIPFFEWPQSGVDNCIAHMLVYVVLALGIYAVLHVSCICYKIIVVRGVFSSYKVFNVLASWLVPILINVVLGLLMPVNIQISVLGVYGYLVWCLTIWLVIDYCMFRFLSIRMLCGQRIDGRWICPAILFCMFIMMMYGVANMLVEQRERCDMICDALKLIDKSCHQDAEQICEGLKELNKSRRQDTEQILKELNELRYHNLEQIYERMGRMKLY